MVNKRFWLGMLVMVLVFGMTVLGCEEEPEEEPGKSITISGIEITWPQYWVRVRLLSGFENWDGAQLVANGGWETPSNGSVTLSMYSGLSTNEPWTGSGSYYIMLEFNPLGDNSSEPIRKYLYTNGKTFDELELSSSLTANDAISKMPKYDISSLITTISFSKFKERPIWWKW
jgi:hypothetical protein